MRVDRGRLGVLILLAEIPDLEPQLTLGFLNEGLILAEKRGIKPELVGIQRGFAAFFKRAGDFGKALEHLEKADELNRTILSEKAEQHIRSLKILHEIANERALAEMERLRNVELQNALDEADKQRKIAIEENRQKSQLLSFAAHDLRNLTGGILSGLQIVTEISRDLEGGEELQDLTESLCDSAEELHYTLLTVMDAGAVEEGKMSFKPEAMDYVDLLEFQIQKLEAQAVKKQQTLDLKYQDRPMVFADFTQLRSIVNNLIENAIKYSPSDSIIRIRLEEDDSSIQFIVEDEGPGLDAADIEKMGRPFQRLSAQPTGGETSIGLGLFVVMKQLEMHGGKLEYSPRTEGGSRFTAHLPKQARISHEVRSS